MYASIILPTYNERENLANCVEAVRQAMGPRTDWEIIVVDDNSPDGTWELAEQLGQQDPRVRLYRRIDRKGLSSAIVDGLAMAAGQRLLVTDADMQHDIRKIPELLAALDTAEVSVGSRYVGGGGISDWAAHRRFASKMATRVCHLLLRVRVTDPMSGFFAIRRGIFERIAPLLNPRGYKILMEILHWHGKPERVAEIAYVFNPRRAGESKLSSGVIWDYGLSLLELASRRFISARFLKYGLVGVSGVGVQFLAFNLLWKHPLSESLALAAAIATAALSNYLINNIWTFHDRRHRGFGAMLKGLAWFLVISGSGAIINHAVSLDAKTWVLQVSSLTDEAALNVGMVVGIMFATAWNYLLNRSFTWSFQDKPE
jgi:dolichol-phosphate mannosyltransferase